ncbi:MAG TPA: hypothetical protein VM865_05990, partial [Acidobacteriaceae bacterium]|nr:hypothetical protein [Acidobacteriaceae bacterium]
MMTSRNEVLKMLRQMETGQQISADELLNLAATIEKDEMKVEQKQDQVKQQEDREPVAEIPDPNIPTPDEAVMVPAESVNSLGSCAPATSTRCFRSAAAFDPTTLADKEFSVAGKIWLESRRVHLRQRVLYGYQHHCKWLTVHFGGMKLRDIHIGHVMAYQTQRA